MARKVLTSLVSFGLLLCMCPLNIAVGDFTETSLERDQFSWWRRWLAKIHPRTRELIIRVRLRGLVRKHLALHFQNLTPRDGVAQLPWVSKGGVRSGAESLRGHVDAFIHLAGDFGKLLGWRTSKINRLKEMAQYHDLDECEDGDLSLWSMEQKLSSNWCPLTREQWYTKRSQEYFAGLRGEPAGREKVKRFLEKNFLVSEATNVLALCDEFYTAQTDVARLAQQLDDYQAVMESAARYLDFKKKHPRSKDVSAARSNFFESYLPQGYAIMEHRVMVLALVLLEERVQELEGSV